MCVVSLGLYIVCVYCLLHFHIKWWALPTQACNNTGVDVESIGVSKRHRAELAGRHVAEPD